MREPTDDEALWRELAVRLALGPSDNEAEAPYLTVLAGTLPALPFPLALPAGTRIIGTVTTLPHSAAPNHPAFNEHTTIYADAPGQPWPISEAFTRQMAQAGWEQHDGPHQQGGFLAAATPHMAARSFRHSTHGSLNIAIVAVGADHNHIMLHMNHDVRREQDHRRLLGQRFIAAVLPPLLSPAGADVQLGNGMGSGDRGYTEADITTDLAPAALHAHYGAELQAASWTRTAEGGDDGAEWSFWHFTDSQGQTWHAVFSAVRYPPPAGRLALRLHAERASSDAGE